MEDQSEDSKSIQQMSDFLSALSKLENDADFHGTFRDVHIHYHIERAPYTKLDSKKKSALTMDNPIIYIIVIVIVAALLQFLLPSVAHSYCDIEMSPDTSRNNRLSYRASSQCHVFSKAKYYDSP